MHGDFTPLIGLHAPHIAIAQEDAISVLHLLSKLQDLVTVDVGACSL
jgi:hypothetical protein